MKNKVTKALQIIKQGGLILYPTDTVWGIGCDATNPKAVEKIYRLKQREESKSMICLVNDYKMLNHVIEEIPEPVVGILKDAKKPTTIIYDNPKHVAYNIIANDNSLAIRIVNHPFCNKLLEKLNNPIISTSANISSKPTPKSFKEISQEIIKGVDYVVNLPDEKSETKPSSIIKLSSDGIIKVIRD